jgi:sugar-specific transcriptional regulator TrmB
MDLSVLEDLGLTPGEIKTYLALMQLGNTKVGRVIERARIASSGVHNALKSLAEKGLVSYVKKGKVKLYRAASPKHMLDYVNEKKAKLEAALPELEKMQLAAGERQEAEVFEGIRGLKALMDLLIEDVGKGDEFLFFVTTTQEQNEEIQRFFSQYDLKRHRLGLIVQGLAPKDIRPSMEWRRHLIMRYPDFPIPTNTSICNDKIAFFSWEPGREVGYLIHSKQIAQRYREFFKHVWKIARRRS